MRRHDGWLALVVIWTILARGSVIAREQISPSTEETRPPSTSGLRNITPWRETYPAVSRPTDDAREFVDESQIGSSTAHPAVIRRQTGGRDGGTMNSDAAAKAPRKSSPEDSTEESESPATADGRRVPGESRASPSRGNIAGRVVGERARIGSLEKGANGAKGKVEAGVEDIPPINSNGKEKFSVSEGIVVDPDLVVDARHDVQGGESETGRDIAEARNGIDEGSLPPFSIQEMRMRRATEVSAIRTTDVKTSSESPDVRYRESSKALATEKLRNPTARPSGRGARGWERRRRPKPANRRVRRGSSRVASSDFDLGDNFDRSRRDGDFRAGSSSKLSGIDFPMKIDSPVVEEPCRAPVGQKLSVERDSAKLERREKFRSSKTSSWERTADQTIPSAVVAINSSNYPEKLGSEMPSVARGTETILGRTTGRGEEVPAAVPRDDAPEDGESDRLEGRGELRGIAPREWIVPTARERLVPRVQSGRQVQSTPGDEAVLPIALRGGTEDDVAFRESRSSASFDSISRKSRRVREGSSTFSIEGSAHAATTIGRISDDARKQSVDGELSEEANAVEDFSRRTATLKLDGGRLASRQRDAGRKDVADLFRASSSEKNERQEKDDGDDGTRTTEESEWLLKRSKNKAPIRDGHSSEANLAETLSPAKSLGSVPVRNSTAPSSREKPANVETPVSAEANRAEREKEAGVIISSFRSGAADPTERRTFGKENDNEVVPVARNDPVEGMSRDAATDRNQRARVGTNETRGRAFPVIGSLRAKSRRWDARGCGRESFVNDKSQLFVENSDCAAEGKLDDEIVIRETPLSTLDPSGDRFPVEVERGRSAIARKGEKNRSRSDGSSRERIDDSLIGRDDSGPVLRIDAPGRSKDRGEIDAHEARRASVEVADATSRDNFRRSDVTERSDVEATSLIAVLVNQLRQFKRDKRLNSTSRNNVAGPSIHGAGTIDDAFPDTVTKEPPEPIKRTTDGGGKREVLLATSIEEINASRGKGGGNAFAEIAHRIGPDVTVATETVLQAGREAAGEGSRLNNGRTVSFSVDEVGDEGGIVSDFSDRRWTTTIAAERRNGDDDTTPLKVEGVTTSTVTTTGSDVVTLSVPEVVKKKSLLGRRPFRFDMEKSSDGKMTEIDPSREKATTIATERMTHDDVVINSQLETVTTVEPSTIMEFPGSVDVSVSTEAPSESEKANGKLQFGERSFQSTVEKVGNVRGTEVGAPRGETTTTIATRVRPGSDAAIRSNLETSPAEETKKTNSFRNKTVDTSKSTFSNSEISAEKAATTRVSFQIYSSGSTTASSLLEDYPWHTESIMNRLTTINPFEATALNQSSNLEESENDKNASRISAATKIWPVKHSAVIEGDLVLGGLMMVHEREDSVVCGPVMPQGGVQALEAMLYTLDKLNEQGIVPGVKIGAHILDDCDKDTYGLEMAVDFIKGSISNIDGAEYHCNKTAVRKVISGVVGAASSVTSIQVANLLRLFRIPQVSFFSTSPELSNKQRFEYFTRTIPSDHYQVKAMVDIVRRMGWSYVSIMYEESNYGIKAFEELEDLLAKYNICIAIKEKLVKDSGVAEETAYDNIVQKLLTKPRARGCIIFGSDQEVAGVMRAVRRCNATQSFSWIGSDGWSARGLVSDGNEPEVEGTLSVQPQANPVKGFEEYFLNLTVENNRRDPWFVEFWEDHFQCRYPNSSATPHNQKYVKPCSTKERLAKQNTAFEGQLQFVSDAVMAFAYAFRDMHTELCNGKPGLCDAMKPTKGTELLKYLRKVDFEGLSGDKFRFDKNGDGPARYNIIHFKQITPGKYRWIRVGEYMEGELHLNMSEIQFKMGHPQPPESVCSLPCDIGQAKKYVEGESCCWHCFNCTQYQIRHPEDETQCIHCPQGTVPDKTHSSCRDIPEVFLKPESGWAIGAMSFSSTGILVTLFVGGVFLKHNDTPVVRASGRELSYVLLSGILLCYLVTFALVLKPTDIVCGIQRFAAGFCFTVVYAALLTKTNRIARIFNAGKHSAKRPSFISPRSQLIICSGLVGVQILINGVWMVIDPAKAMYHYPTREDNLLVCNSYIDASYMIAFSYPILLIVVCTVYAILTRKIPEAFNESKHIGFTMYTTCVIWLAFVPLYFGTGNHVALRITSMSVTISLSASVTIACLFGPKLYIILIRPERNVRQSMMPARYSTTKSSAVTGTNASSMMAAVTLTAATCDQNKAVKKHVITTIDCSTQSEHYDIELKDRKNGKPPPTLVSRSTQTLASAKEPNSVPISLVKELNSKEARENPVPAKQMNNTRIGNGPVGQKDVSL